MRQKRKQLAQINDIMVSGVGMPDGPISMSVQGLRRRVREGPCAAP